MSLESTEENKPENIFQSYAQASCLSFFLNPRSGSRTIADFGRPNLRNAKNIAAHY